METIICDCPRGGKITFMRNRLLVFLFAFACVLPAQQKKVIANLRPELAAEVQKVAPNVRIVPARGADVAREIVDADGILGVNLTPDLFRMAKKLQWYQTGATGMENALFPELVESQIVVTNLKQVYGPQIADHAFAFLLALTRRLNITIPRQQLEEWPSGRDGMYVLEGKTAVVIGVGGIGSAIAQRAHGFGMKVIGVDIRDMPPTVTVQRFVPPDMLDEVLPEADVVFVSVPHTKQTQGMLGPRQFELMKKNSYFIAVSRGKIYDHGALVKALDSKHLAGAGLDVTDPEPLPKGHPLWKFQNVVITPHVSGGSDQLQARTESVYRENLRRFSAGLPMINVVDKREGY